MNTITTEADVNDQNDVDDKVNSTNWTTSAHPLSVTSAGPPGARTSTTMSRISRACSRSRRFVFSRRCRSTNFTSYRHEAFNDLDLDDRDLDELDGLDDLDNLDDDDDNGNNISELGGNDIVNDR